MTTEPSESPETTPETSPTGMDASPLGADELNPEAVSDAAPASEPERPAAYPYIQAPPPKAKRTGNRAPRSLTATVAIAALVGGGVGAGVVGAGWMVSASQAGTQSVSPAQQLTINDASSVSQVSAVAAKALPSVVTIKVSSGNSGGTGSGVVLSADGYIVTNTHVVTMEGAASNPTISVITSSGEQYPGTLIGTDPNSDLAVVKVQASNLTPIEFANSDELNVGATTIAIGAPMELSNTVTHGIISALHRGIEIQSSAAPNGSSNDGGSTGGSPFEFWNYNGQQQQGGGASSATISLSVIQTDAAINPGNSGGALLDGAGKLIGVNVAILSNSSSSSSAAGSIGIGFAIPANQVQRVAKEIIETGTATHGLLGASVTSADSNSSSLGALVKEASAGGPAARAGIQAGDVITEFNGVRVGDQVDLTAMVRSQAAGSQVTVVVLRNGKNLSFTVTLDAFSG
ncbi:MAG: S1C family serine protease [Agromyces sp.]